MINVECHLHEQQKVRGFCLNLQCQKLLFCSKCLRDQEHLQHQNDCKFIEELIQMLLKCQKVLQKDESNFNNLNSYLNNLSFSVIQGQFNQCYFYQSALQKIKLHTNQFLQIIRIQELKNEIPEIISAISDNHHSYLQKKQKQLKFIYRYYQLLKNEANTSCVENIIGKIKLVQMRLEKNQILVKLQNKIQQLKAYCFQKGKQLFDELNYNDALICFDKILKRLPYDVEALLYRSEILIQLCKFEDALECSKKVTQIDSAFSVGQLNIGIALKEMGCYKEALIHFNNAVIFDKYVNQTYLYKGQILYLLNQYNDSINCFDQIQEIHNNFYKALYFKSFSFLKEGNFYQSLQCVCIAIEKIDGIIQNYYSQWDRLIEYGLMEESKQVYKKIVIIRIWLSQSYIMKSYSLEVKNNFYERINCLEKGIRIGQEASQNIEGLTKSLDIYDIKEILDSAVKFIGSELYAVDNDEQTTTVIQRKNKTLNFIDMLEQMKNKDLIIKCYDEFIRQNPLSKWGYLAKSRILLNIKQSDEAIKCLESWIKNVPENREAFLTKGLILIELKRYDEALIFYDEWIQKDCCNSLAYQQKCKLLILLNQINNAIACSDIWIKFDPYNSSAYIEKGELLSNLNKFQQAIKCYQDCINLNPYSSQAYVMKSKALIKINRYHDAIDCFETCIKINPADQDSYIKLAELLIQMNLINEALKIYDDWIQKESDNEKIIQLKGSYNFYKQLIDQDPKNSFYYQELGEILISQNQLEKAIDCYRDCLKVDPSLSWAYIKLGQTLMISKNLEQPLACYNELIKQDPKYNFAYLLKAKVLKKLDRFEEALQAYDNWIEILPQDSSGYFQKGKALTKKGWFDQAISCYESWIKQDSLDNTPYFEKGEILINQKQYNAAIECYTQWIEQKSDCVAYLFLGLTLEQVKFFDKALEIYQIWKKEHPIIQETVFFEGRMLLKFKRFDETQKLLINNTHIEQYKKIIIKGNFLESKMELNEALLVYETLIQKYSTNPEGYFYAANILEQMEQNEKLIKCYDKWISIDPENPYPFLQKFVVLLKHLFSIEKIPKNSEAVECNYIDRFPKYKLFLLRFKRKTQQHYKYLKSSQ